MDPSVEIAIIGAMSVVAAAFSPLLQVRINNRQRQRERAEDRADRLEVAQKVDNAAREAKAVASQAAKAAILLLEAQKVAIEKTDQVAAAAEAVAAVAVAATAETKSQLNQIHTLVNSNMTAAQQGELDQTRVTLVMLRKIVVMAATAGRDPSSEELDLIDRTERRVSELEHILADRMTQQQLVEAEILKEKTP